MIKVKKGLADIQHEVAFASGQMKMSLKLLCLSPQVVQQLTIRDKLVERVAQR